MERMKAVEGLPHDVEKWKPWVNLPAPNVYKPGNPLGMNRLAGSELSTLSGLRKLLIHNRLRQNFNVDNCLVLGGTCEAAPGP